MSWHERRQLRRCLEQRVLAGERKSDIVRQAAVEGQNWQDTVRVLALVPTPASRRRYRWLNRALVGLLVLAAAVEIPAALAYAMVWDDHFLWLAMDFAWAPLMILAALGVARFCQFGYNGAFGVALVRGVWWVIAVAMQGQLSFPPAVVYGQIALLVGIAALATLVPRLLLPNTRWIDSTPKTDPAGIPVFEE